MKKDQSNPEENKVIYYEKNRIIQKFLQGKHASAFFSRNILYFLKKHPKLLKKPDYYCLYEECMTFMILHSLVFSDDHPTEAESRQAWQTMIRAHVYCFPEEIAVDRETVDAYINYRRPHWCEMKRLLKEFFGEELPSPSGF